MNTKKRLLLLGGGGILVILLIVAVLLIQLLPKRQTVDGSETDGNVTPAYKREQDEIYSITERQIKSVTVNNSHGTYTVVKNDDGDVVIEGAESVPLMTETVTNLFKSVVSITSESRIETNCTDFSPYGLDNPSATVTVTTYRDTSDVLLIGDKTPDGGAYYFVQQGKTTVFCVNTYFAERAQKAQSELYELTVSKPFTEENFLSLDIDYNDKSKNLSVRFCTEEENESRLYADSMIITSPFVFGANSSVVRSYGYSTHDLEASEVVCISPSASDMKKYGFSASSPLVSIGFTVDTSEETIDNITNPYYDSSATEGTTVQVASMYLLGGTEDGKQYIMYDDADVIYAVDESAFAFAYESTDVFCQANVFIRYLSELKAIEIKSSDADYYIDVWTETADDGTVTYCGKYKSRELQAANLQNFYREIIAVSNIGMCTDPGTKAILTITLYGNDGKNSTVQFAPVGSDGMYMFARINGEGRFYVSSNTVNRIIKDVKNLCDGKDVTFEY